MEDTRVCARESFTGRYIRVCVQKKKKPLFNALNKVKQKVVLKPTFYHDFCELSEHGVKRWSFHRLVGQTHADEAGQLLGGRFS